MQKITIAAARTSAGLTQQKLAEKLGVSRNLVAKIETGKVKIRPVYLYAICHITGFNESDILLP